MKEATKTIINIFALHIVSIFSVALYFLSVLSFYPIGYFAHILSYLGILSAVGILFIYLKPSITKKFFIVTILGAIFTIFLYILTTEQDWTVFAISYVLMGVSCVLFLFLALRFLK